MFNISNEYFIPSVSSSNFIYNNYMTTSYYSTDNQNYDYHSVWNENGINIGRQTDAPRGFKRRVSANKKERRRTQSINTAFSDLRTAIPNVQPDTKLSKIKTLKLATKYIEYLMDILSKDDPNIIPGAFKAEIIKTRKEQIKFDNFSSLRKTRGRTGWPQTVWQSELNRHENLHQHDSSLRDIQL